MEKDILELIKDVFTIGVLVKTLNMSKIALIPKTWDLTLLPNFRLLSLLGVIHKSIAKVMANKMKQFIQDWILS